MSKVSVVRRALSFTKSIKFDTEPYKLFTLEDVKNGIKSNLRGKFTWESYVKNSNPDHKFGHNKFKYITQLPILGLVFVTLLYIPLVLVVYPSIFVQQLKESFEGDNNE